jgi:hypothetical protein
MGYRRRNAANARSSWGSTHTDVQQYLPAWRTPGATTAAWLNSTAPVAPSQPVAIAAPITPAAIALGSESSDQQNEKFKKVFFTFPETSPNCHVKNPSQRSAVSKMI